MILYFATHHKLDVIPSQGCPRSIGEVEFPSESSDHNNFIRQINNYSNLYFFQEKRQIQW